MLDGDPFDLTDLLGSDPLGGTAGRPRGRSSRSPSAPAPPVRVAAPGAEPFGATPASALPTFADVGGMDELKRELDETVGVLLAFAGEAERYGVSWNGLLLHGPPGVGKTFLVQALAGEYGLDLVRVSCTEIVDALRGESARNVARAFAAAARNAPCVLFFDEFDSIAQRRDGSPDDEARRVVNTLLQSLEEYRDVREVVVVAATNDYERLDPAVIRPGRFDRHVRVDLPDAAARAAIFAAALAGRPTGDDVDVDELARRTEGLTPAAIEQIVDRAALRELAGGAPGPLGMQELLAALASRGGDDRPTVEGWSWDKLVLAEQAKSELQVLQALLEDPERARELGIDPPSGALLTGPPGTGKTTIARVLAAEANCSFYAISAADVMSKWVGESEQNLRRLFERARENRPSIVFIDEIDALGARRGDTEAEHRPVNQLLVEIDGVTAVPGVFVLGATNRPDQLDAALLRGGRLSRTIEIPLPDLEGRAQLLRLFTARMPLAGVDLAALARATDGLSGADLEALCQQAAVASLVRDGASTPPVVSGDDFRNALGQR